jgi:hypothetical protein
VSGEGRGEKMIEDIRIDPVAAFFDDCPNMPLFFSSGMFLHYRFTT